MQARTTTQRARVGRWLLVPAVAGACGWAEMARGASSYNQANDTWHNAAYWTPAGLPAGNTIISGGRTAAYSTGTTVLNGYLFVGDAGNAYGQGGEAGSGVLNISGGILRSSNDIISIGAGGSSGTLTVSNGAVLETTAGGAWKFGVGDGGTGVLTITGAGSAVNTPYMGWNGGFQVGCKNGSYGNGTVNLTDGALNVKSFTLGVNGATGAVVQNSGTVTVSDFMSLGLGSDNASGVATYQILGGSLAVAGDFSLNENKTQTCTFTQGGGTVTLNGAGQYVGRSSLGRGVYNISAGTLNAGRPNTRQFRVGGPGAASNGELNISGTALVDTRVSATRFQIGGGPGTGVGGTGLVTISGGTLQMQDFVIGQDGGAGSLVVNGGLVTVAGFMSMGLGNPVGTGSASCQVNGGTLTAGADCSVNESKSTDCTFTQTGGTVNLNGATKCIGRSAAGGKGIYTISGGALNMTANGDLQVAGVQAGSKGELNVSGTGSVNVSGVYALAVGRHANGQGTVNQTGGTVTLAANSTLGVWLAPGGAGATGTYNLNGGTLVTPRFTPDAGAGVKALNFGGGTLRANASFTVGTATSFATLINGGGATVDTAGNNMTWQPVLAAGTGSGGLTKLGAGELYLTAANTYGGDTAVGGGTLKLGNVAALQNSTLDYGSYGGALDVTAVASATLGGLKGAQSLGLPNNFALTVGHNGQTTVYGGGLSGSGAALTKTGGGALTLGGANGFGGLAANAGTLTITGSTTITGTGGNTVYVGNLLGANGTLTIESGGTLTITGSIGDACVIGRDGGRGTVTQNGGTVNYNPGNRNELYIGASNNANTTALYNMNGGVLDLNGKTLGIALGVGSGVFQGALNQSGGAIANVGTLKLGVLSLATGVYNLTGGSMAIGAGGIVTDDNLYALNLGGGTLSATATWGSALNMTLTGAGGNVTFDTAGNGIALSGRLSGAGGLTKAGAGTLTLAAANTHAGTTRVTGGLLRATLANALGATTNLTVEAGAQVVLDANNVVFDGTRVYLNAGAGFGMIALNNATPEEIRELYFNGVLQDKGTWGAPGSGAEHIDGERFSGAGTLYVRPGGTVFAIK